MKIRKHRDLTLIDINDDQILVVSCDSSGGIGNKENDIVQAPPEIVGQLTTQVGLMEMLAFGASPITVVDTLSVEVEDTGRRILKGIKKALEPLDFDLDNVITGSTEENFPVTVTGIGITIIGIINKDNWKRPITERGLIAAVVGLPKIGYEVLEDEGSIMDVQKLLELKEKDYIKEILPVGSKGILHELEEMAKTNNINFSLEDKQLINLKKSSGPSTCVIISMEEKEYKNLKREFSIPVNRIASFT